MIDRGGARSVRADASLRYGAWGRGLRSRERVRVPEVAEMRMGRMPDEKETYPM
jgi:hypothetical protein